MNNTTSQTLKDNLIKMYDNNPGLTRSKFDFNDPSELLLTQHDSQHFIFGCGTDAEGEMALQISIFLLSDLSPAEIFKMYTAEEEVETGELVAKSALDDLFKTFGKLKFLDKIKTIFRLIGHFLSCLWIKITTRQRFPFLKTHEFLDWEVKDIQKKFHIKPYIQSSSIFDKTPINTI
jgi:hypothetical protein